MLTLTRFSGWPVSALGSLLTIMAMACGGGSGTPPPPVISVAISPPTAPVITGQSTQFTATVTGTSDQNVTWSIVGASPSTGNSTVGTISVSGLYTSPADVPYPSTVTVRATSSFDNTGFGTAAATVTSPVEDWPKYHRDLANTGRSIETGINSQTAPHLKQKWVFTTGGIVSASPAVATANISGTPTPVVFVGSWDGIFHALDAVTGAEIWSFTIDAAPSTGECATQPIACTRIASSPAVSGGNVYFGAGNGFAYSLNAATGAKNWGVQLGDPTAGAEIWESPAVNNDKVYFSTSSHDDTPCVPGQVLALNAATGANLWTFNVLQGCPMGQTCVGGGVWSSPAVDLSFSSPVLYIGTGNPGNSCSPPSSGTPATAYTDGILALDATTGALLKFYQAYAYDPADAFDFGSSPVLHTTDQCTSSGTATWVTEANKGGTLFTLARNSSGLIPSSAIPTNIDAFESIPGDELIATPALVPSTGTTACNDLFQPTVSGYLFDLEQAGDGTGAISIVQDIPINVSGGCATLGNCPLDSAPASVADVLIFGGGDCNVYGYTNSGLRVFSFATSQLSAAGFCVASGPAISHSRVYFASFNGNIFCLSVDGQ